MKKRFTDEQIIGFLKEAEADTCTIKELCRKHGFSDAAFYGWRSRFGGMEVADAARLRNLEAENGKRKGIKRTDNSALQKSVHQIGGLPYCHSRGCSRIL